MFGQLKGMAGAFINLPQIITISLAASLVPAISEAVTKKSFESIKKNTELAIRVSLIIGLPAAAGLIILAQPIMTMIYPRESVSLVEALQYLAPAVVFLTLVQTMTGILQGMGKERVPVANMIIGALIKVVISFTLTSIPAINIKGAALGTVCGYAAATFLNMHSIRKHQNIDTSIMKLAVKPSLASAIMGIVTFLFYALIFAVTNSNTIAVILALLVAVPTYFIALLVLKGITEEDLLMVPGGQKLLIILKKKRLM